jgi:DNA-binding NarL/FixJ family response regulator
MKEKKSVLIAEPSCIIAEGLVKILEESPLIEPLYPLYDIDLIETRLAAAKPDILLINPTMLSVGISAVFKDASRSYPSMAIIALVYQYLDPSQLRAFHGRLDIREERDKIATTLLDSLQTLAETENTEDNSYELSKRETDVLVLIAKGFMNKEIADRLNISVHTVISHRKNISRKTNIRSSAGLAIYAMMNNLIEEAPII